MDQMILIEIYSRIEKLNLIMRRHKVHRINNEEFILALHKGTDDLLEYVPRDPRMD